jgi:hypothetical protein
LFFLEHASDICLGLIGKTKFCLKSGCATQLHEVSKQDMGDKVFYVKENDG